MVATTAPCRTTSLSTDLSAIEVVNVHSPEAVAVRLLLSYAGGGNEDAWQEALRAFTAHRCPGCQSSTLMVLLDLLVSALDRSVPAGRRRLKSSCAKFWIRWQGPPERSHPMTSTPFTPHNTPYTLQSPAVGGYPRVRPTVDPVTAGGAVDLGDIGYDPTASPAPGVDPSSDAPIGDLGATIDHIAIGEGPSGVRPDLTVAPDDDLPAPMRIPWQEQQPGRIPSNSQPHSPSDAGVR